MKEITNSISKTTEWLRHDFRFFDFPFYCQQIIAGLRKDISAKIQADIEGEWLHAQDSKGRFFEVNIYQKFEAI